MRAFVKAAKAVAEPSRLLALKMLQARGSLCVCQIQPALGLAQPTVSKHLKVLEEAGFIRGHKRGLWVHYALNPEPTPLVAGFLDLVARSLDKDPDLARALFAIGPPRDPASGCGC
jgi:ArsR family transcriptional regulator, arsenate/arsenite/antimonite-responsive transcriptional repressor